MSAQILTVPNVPRRLDPSVQAFYTRRLQVCMVRPELQALADNIDLKIDQELAAGFRVASDGAILLSPGCVSNPVAGAVIVRQALEMSIWQGLWSKSKRDPQHHHHIDDFAWTATVALLAARTAGGYLSLLSATERATAQKGHPSWLSDLYAKLGSAPKWSSLSSVLGNRGASLRQLLTFSGVRADVVKALATSSFLKTTTCNLLAQLGTAALPVEMLLTCDGDDRIKLDAHSGHNGYGSRVRPPIGQVTADQSTADNASVGRGTSDASALFTEISFSSSTASSISPTQYHACETIRQQMITATIAGNRSSLTNGLAAQIKTDIMAACGLDAALGADLILTASGTDSEVIALRFSLAASEAPLTNIVIASNESGSGVCHAATGRHYRYETCAGHRVEAGHMIAGTGHASATLEHVALRHHDGRVRDPELVDEDVRHLVKSAIASGSRCLLHILDTSKTGMGGPSLPQVAQLKARLGDKLDVVVDACQLRLSPAAIRYYLQQGYLVQITGSKFYCGPPFCGALLVPATMISRARAKQMSIDGLHNYSVRSDWPASLALVANNLPMRVNFGLLTRWTAALVEMRRFKAIEPAKARETMASFARDVERLITARKDLTLVSAPTFARDLPGFASKEAARNSPHSQSMDDIWTATEDHWAGIKTIVSFTINAGVAGNKRSTGLYDQALPLDDVKAIHKLLNRDLTDMLESVRPAATNYITGFGSFGNADPRQILSEQDRKLAATPCLIGQPVVIATPSDGSSIAALRICSSARIIADLHSERPDDASLAHRQQRLLADVNFVLDKIALITQHLDHLRSAAGIG